MPDALIQTWHNHPYLGDRFKDFLTEFHDEFGVHVTTAQPSGPGGHSPGKRASENDPEGGLLKRSKIDDSCIKLVADLPAATEAACK
eukprot:11765855-Alexandrium_andersonii.AAC.1